MITNTASQLGAGDDIGAPVRVGDLVASKYLIERTLGVGGMGVVVLARDQLLERRVAIKFLLPKLAGSETAVQRFMREARAATRVTSEHVVRLLEIEKLPSGTPFFVMEYLEGSDLRALLREHDALPHSRAVDYVLQALQAVAEGHVKGIVHRDIKPGNLFLTMRADGTPLIKVLDFGIAKTIDGDAAESTSLTSSDDVRLGSPAYMPPEQLQNPRDVDKRSDIWSIGATLYELLCARPPFEGPGYLELASRILSQPPIPLSEQRLHGPLPDGLESVLLRCLEKDRNARFSNAAELASALAPFGSEDARVSLGRVTGMFTSHASIPPVSHSILEEPAFCTATLEAPGAARVNVDERRTSDIGAVASTPRAKPGRSWLVLGAAVALILAVFALRNPTAPSARAAAPELPAVDAQRSPQPEQVAPPLAPVADVAPPGQVEPHASVAAPPESALGQPARPTQPVALPSQSLPAPRPKKASSSRSTPPAGPVQPVALAPSAPLSETAQARAAEPERSVEVVTTPGLGRSPEIERLIEQRR